MTRRLVISLHDVAPSTLAETSRWREVVEGATGGPVSLLVVPRYRGRDSWRSGPGRDWLADRAQDGDELVLHGYSHLSTTGADGRELAGRRPWAVTAVIADGVRELTSAGLAADGFIAPSYWHPGCADDACRTLGIRWWATRGALRWENGSRRLPSLGLGASTATRRVLSPAAARSAARLLAAAAVVRLDLHPADLRDARLERAGRELLARLLDQGRRLTTHGSLAG